MLWSTVPYLFQIVLSTTGLHPHYDIFFDHIPSPSFIGGSPHRPYIPGSRRFGPNIGPRRPARPSPDDPSGMGCGTIPNGCPPSRYRSYDGTCNSLRNPVTGTPNAPYTRLLPPNYGDVMNCKRKYSPYDICVEIENQEDPCVTLLELTAFDTRSRKNIEGKFYPTILYGCALYSNNTQLKNQLFIFGKCISTPTIARSGNQLPSARTVSLLVYPDVLIVDPQFTLNAMQYGQIITHDMSMIAGSTQAQPHQTRCCSDDGQLLELANIPEHCFPIMVPTDDPIHSRNNIRCMNFVRTITDRDRSCVGGSQPAEQLTVVNHFLDLSLVYGNTAEVNQQLRQFQGGYLRVDIRQNQQWPPRSNNASGICNLQRAQDACYQTGDARANQNPQLTLLQIVFLREHNRLAGILGQLNPHWDDETIFQEARKINIAQHQQITYYEWLPIFLGEDNLVQSGIIWHTNGYVNDYDDTVDPTVLNEHATAAFRYFHTLIIGNLHLITEGRGTRGTLRLSDWLNRPQILEEGDNFDDLARGLNTQCQHAADQFHDSEITHFLFRAQQQFGSDLKALDVQRNRDHGLASYNDYREYCGLPRATYFNDFLDVINSDNVQRLAALYECPDDVDLTVGGSLEQHVPGTLVGPTFLCILREQFYRTRVGDRYWYENPSETGFTLEQLFEIRKSSISRLLCNNGRNIRSMQPRGFEKVSADNNIVPCEQLPDLDLSLWKDTPGSFGSIPTNLYFKK